MTENVRVSNKATCQTIIGHGTSFQSLEELLEGADTSLTRREKVQAWIGQVGLFEWSRHLTDHHPVAQNESKKHKFDLRAHIVSKKHNCDTDCQLGT